MGIAVATSTIKIRKDYADVLSQFGNLQEVSNIFLENSILIHIRDKIEEYNKETKVFELRYGMSCDDFLDKTGKDEEFVNALNKTHPTWEADIIEWEFSYKELQEWKQRLKNILKG